jgi:FPC/CPF motif-containing protein YcgG
MKPSDISSLISGVQMKHGNFKFCFADSKNLFILTHHHTNTAHSGSIQSLQIFFNSFLIYSNISSYLAVVI